MGFDDGVVVCISMLSVLLVCGVMNLLFVV